METYLGKCPFNVSKQVYVNTSWDEFVLPKCCQLSVYFNLVRLRKGL